MAARNRYNPEGFMDEGDHREGKDLVDALREDLRQNRGLMEKVHKALVRERRDPPPWLDDVIRRIENLESDIYGNGREGIKAVVTRLHERDESRVPGSNENWSWRFLISVIAAVATVIAAIVTSIAMVVVG